MYKNNKILNEIINSKNGIHLCMYFNSNSNKLSQVKIFSAFLKNAEEELRPVMSDIEIIKFLKPLKSLKDDKKMFNKLNNSIGIFRTTNSFKIINLPTQVEDSYSLADSFFVKPILNWMQEECEFALVGINTTHASLLYGSIANAQLVDKLDLSRASKSDLAQWINQWKLKLSLMPDTKIIFIGNEPEIKSIYDNFKHPKKFKKLVNISFVDDFKVKYLNEIRKILKKENEIKIRENISNFSKTTDLEYYSNDIFEIAEAISNGKLTKLMISNERKIFGKFNLSDGSLKIHSRDLNHEDDDLLDDLAQEVLKQGKQVVIFNSTQAGDQVPISAIIKSSLKELNLEISL